MNNLQEMKLDSGRAIYQYLQDNGIPVKSGTALETSNNVCLLEDGTSFNWKANSKCIRLNCKIEMMQAIESFVGLTHFDNGPGDPPRPYSFWIENTTELEEIIKVLKRRLAQNGK